MRVWQRCIGWMAVSLALSADTQAAGASQPRPACPNVVFILVDDLGYADLGCYGAKDIRTPHIDRLAAGGVRLTDCYSNGPVCTPTRAAFITGRYQQRVGLEWALSAGQEQPGLPVEETSIARMLNDAGYATGMFGKWHLGYRPEFGPNAHGFDEFFGLLSGNHDFYSHRESNNKLDLYEDVTPMEIEGYTTDLINQRAEAFIHKHAGRPFFLYVAYNAPHWPFQPPDKPDDVRTPGKNWFDGDREDYRGMVERIDEGVGRMMAALNEHGLEENTIVVFTNDNGGERLSDMGPLFHRKGTLWEGGIRVPGIVRWPAQLPAGRVLSQPVITMDFTASILAACGVEPPAGRKLDGINVLPILAGKQAPVSRTFCWRIDRNDRKQMAIRQGDWKLVRDGNIELLYHLADDVRERTDLGWRHPEVRLRLREALNQWNHEMNQSKPAYVVK